MNKSTIAIDPDYQEPSIWSNWLRALTNPFLLLHACIEVLNSFRATRPWRRLLVFSPFITVVIIATGLVIWGKAMSRETLVMRYAVWAEAELARLKSATSSPEPNKLALVYEEQSSPFSDMLYRRLLQLNDSNARTRYLVAVQMARSSRIDQARNLMEEIAPVWEDKKGYEPAHAWLAVDLLSRQPLKKEEMSRLQSHLEAIQNWESTSSGLLAIQAGLLESIGRKSEAMDAMAKAAKKDPGLLVSYSIMARRLNISRVADETSQKARQRLNELIRRPDAKIQDFIQLATLELTEGKLENALRATRDGLKLEGDGLEQLRFLASEAYRLMYRKSLQKTAKGIEFNLNLLDLAMKEYPANPNVGTEIALLENLGIDSTAELKSLLEQQLANGQASALSHLILATQKIKAGRMPDAIPHLELTVKAAPNSPVALNNLALSLALTDTTQLKRAEELIDRAIKIDPSNPEFYDSQGQIRQIAARPLDAVESFEKAISLDPRRTGTRELVIKAYRDAGLNDLASQQEKTLAELKAELARRQSLKRNAEPQIPLAAPDASIPAAPNSIPPVPPSNDSAPATTPSKASGK